MTIKRFSTFVLAVLLAAHAGTASAEPDVAHYKKLKGSDEINLYIKGMGDGFDWANVAMQNSSGGRKLYCPPENLPLQGNNYVDIIDRELKARAYPDDSPVGLVLLAGLQRTFPCPSP